MGERQMCDLGVSDRLPRCAGLGVDQRSFRSDVYYGFDRAGFERDVDRSRDGGVNLEVIHHGLLESLRLYRDLIDDRFERRRGVGALPRSRQLLRPVRSNVGNGDRGPRYYRSCLIEYRAADAATVGLRGNGGAANDGDE